MLMGDTDVKVLHASKTETASFTGAAVDVSGDVNPGKGNMLFLLDCGAATGTLDAKIQQSDDGATGWADVTGAAFTTINAAPGTQIISAYVGKRYIRVLTTAASSPNHTYGVYALGVKRLA